MESIKQIYRIGHGPSSSHTMGPMRAARMFLERNRGAVRFNVTLYGSLAATGKGHMTDAAILVEPGGQDQYHLGTEGVPAFSSERHPLPVV